MLWVTYGLIEPFYIAAGFGIYLNSRVHLEAWDIELGHEIMAHNDAFNPLPPSTR